MNNVPEVQRGSGDRTDPFRAMAKMQRDMDRLFDSFWSGGSDFPAMQSSFQPLCEVEDQDTHYLISFDVPGLSQEDVKVELQDNNLHVYGERKQDREQNKGKRFQSERYYGSMERWIALPSDVKAEGIEAHMENGVLQIAVPKAEVAKPQEIKIGNEKTGFFSRLLGNEKDKKGAKDKAA